jgi:hypothetical protein
MIMIKIALILFLSISMLNCCGQKKGVMTELVDTIPSGTPFVLKRNDMFLDLSSKLGVQEIKGIVGLTVYIDSTENLTGFRISKLKIESSERENVNFTDRFDSNRPYQKDEYPMEVQQYVNELKFERDNKIPLKAMNEITFIARIK